MAPKILAHRVYGVPSFYLDLPHNFNPQCFAHTKPVYLWVFQLKAPTMRSETLFFSIRPTYMGVYGTQDTRP